MQPPPAPAAEAPPPAPLPSGWFSSFDTRGNIFYYNLAGESTWTHPALRPVPGVPPVAAVPQTRPAAVATLTSLASSSVAAVAATVPAAVAVIANSSLPAREAPKPKAAVPAKATRPVAEEDGVLPDPVENGEVDDDTFCVMCRSGENADSLMLCDMCDRGFHAACVVPPVLDPAAIDSWYCMQCAPVHERRVRDDKTRPPHKPSTRAAKPKPVKTDSAEDENEEDENDDDSVCAECNQAEENETLLICDSCAKSYHLKCVGLAQVPDSETWYCGPCKNKGTRRRRGRPPLRKTTRVRKRARSSSESSDSEVEESSLDDEAERSTRVASAKKLSKRAGVAKKSASSPAAPPPPAPVNTGEPGQPVVKRPRGRPRKIRPVEQVKTALDVLQENVEGAEFVKLPTAPVPSALAPLTDHQVEVKEAQAAEVSAIAE